MILIVTSEHDLTADYVILELRRRNLRHLRLNTENFSQAKVHFSPQAGEQCWTISLDNETIDLSTIKAAYFRRPGDPVISPKVIGDAERRYCYLEWRELLSAALSSIGLRWLNSPLAILSAESKPRQLAMAIRLGFRVPETIVTNSAGYLIKFLQEGPAVAKPLRMSLLEDRDSERVIFTTRLSPGDPSPESISVAPLIIQREIAKKFDIRVTVVGEIAFAAEIQSQDNEETQTDWRRGNHAELVHRTHELPGDIYKRCVSLTREFGLKFSAIDLVLDRMGTYWFLEINPNGQWAWIQNRTGLPIAQAIVDELEKISAS